MTMACRIFFGVHKWTVRRSDTQKDPSQIGNKYRIGRKSRIGLAPAGIVARVRFRRSATHGINNRLPDYPTL